MGFTGREEERKRAGVGGESGSAYSRERILTDKYFRNHRNQALRVLRRRTQVETVITRDLQGQTTVNEKVYFK